MAVLEPGESRPRIIKSPGALYLFDLDAFQAQRIEPTAIGVRPEKDLYPDCDSPPDYARSWPHGTAVTKSPNGRDTLLVVNHGERESVEIYRIAYAAGRPNLTWAGCVTLPAWGQGNGVAPLPDGGMVVTTTYDPTDPGQMEKSLTVEPTGSVAVWRPGAGWARVAGAVMSGPNGLVVDKAGRTAFVGAFAGRRIYRIDLAGETARNREVDAGFLVDNLSWADDGSILAAGQDMTIRERRACAATPGCTVGSKVVRVDPETLQATVLLPAQRYEGMGRTGATGALLRSNGLWVTSNAGDCVVVFAAAAGEARP